MLTNSCVKLQTVHSIPMTMNKEGQFHAGLFLGCISIKFFSLTFDLSAAPTDDESSGLYGFLNVIVHSASGLKQSLSKRPNIMRSSWKGHVIIWPPPPQSLVHG